MPNIIRSTFNVQVFLILNPQFSILHLFHDCAEADDAPIEKFFEFLLYRRSLVREPAMKHGSRFYMELQREALRFLVVVREYAQQPWGAQAAILLRAWYHALSRPDDEIVGIVHGHGVRRVIDNHSFYLFNILYRVTKVRKKVQMPKYIACAFGV